MIRQEPKVHFLYENVDLETFSKEKAKCDEVDFAGFEDVHAKACLRIDRHADLAITLRRDGPTEDQWSAKGTIKIVLWNETFRMDGSYPAAFCNDKPFHVVDLMSRKALKTEVGDAIFNVDVSVKFEKWDGLKVQKLFQFDHKYLDSDLNLNVQGRDFYVRSKTVFQEIPSLREYLEHNFEAGTKKYVLGDLQGQHSVQAFETMLQVAVRCSFITNINEVGEVLSLSFRFVYPTLKRKCEYFLINEPETDWMQKLIFADLYDLPLLRKHVMDNIVGLGQICKNLHFHRFLSTETLRHIMAKAVEMKNLKQFGDVPPNGYKTYNLAEITENRWERLKRIPLTSATPTELDVSTCMEKFETTFMPKHFGVELITPAFSFADEKASLFHYKVQLGPDFRLLFNIEWNNIQPGNFVWFVDTAVNIRMSYLGVQTWEHLERARFDYDHQSVFIDGLHIQKVFPGGVEHLLDGLGNNSTLPKVEIMVVVEKIRGLELYPTEEEDVESMDEEWILQPVRSSPIVCCGKYLYVDKEVLRSKSKVFSKIFEQTYEPITIPLHFEKFNIFSIFLDILHGEDVQLNYQNVFLLQEFARLFQVSNVLDATVEWLIEEPGMGILQKLEVSETFGIPELQKAAVESILSLDDLFRVLRDLSTMSRRSIQILQDRMELLPFPEHDDTDTDEN